jgi:hypothetical protein
MPGPIDARALATPPLIDVADLTEFLAFLNKEKITTYKTYICELLQYQPDKAEVISYLPVLKHF